MLRSAPENNMPQPTDDFTPIELEFLKWVWIWKLRAEGNQVGDDFRYLVLRRIR